MTPWQRATLSDAMGAHVIYRNLAPVDPALPGLQALWAEAGLERYQVPRKTTVEYARTVWLILQAAQRARGSAQSLKRVLLIGDSARNDGAVARNMAMERPSRAFIGMDDAAQTPHVEIATDTMTANRWSALAGLLPWLESSDFACDESTAVLIDLDKTSIGARGRNDAIIDLARVRAAERTAAKALGSAYDAESFRALYARLIRPECHWITEDNQDYVAYIAIMVASGVLPEDRFWEAMQSHGYGDITAFCDIYEAEAGRMTGRLLETHSEVREGLRLQDPTPFKSFRNDEFLETLALMDVLPDAAEPAQVLTSEIVITSEIMELAELLQTRGALVFGLSDKPDEASLPTEKAAREGLRAIHATPMKVYGERLV